MSTDEMWAGDELDCPLPKCAGKLQIIWTASRVISRDDELADLSDATGAHYSTWEIGCTDGHTLLLPQGIHADRDETQFGDGERYIADALAEGETPECEADMDRLARLTQMTIKETA